MSLQPGINPLEAAKQADFLRAMKRNKAAQNFREGMVDRAKQADFNQHMQNTGPGMTNMGGISAAPGRGPGMAMTGGFDASDLMKTPGMIQQSTRDQAEKVSAPYREANMMAADKTNPMNAASQEPGKSFLMKYIGK